MIRENTDRPLDLICLGRVAVDLYGQQIGARLEDVTSFAKYLGGSSGNVCLGAARLGLRSSMLSRVGDEQFGRFIREELQRAGVDTRGLVTDPSRLTGLAILGIKSRDTFPLLFYRNDCADMSIGVDDIDEAHIRSARALAITGTHLSNSGPRAAVLRALSMGQRHGLLRVLDIDYRPVLWGLTTPGDGETRFVPAAAVTAELQDCMGQFDVVVGTEEEFQIAGGSTDTVTALRAVRALTNAVLVCKRGVAGCVIFEEAVGSGFEDGRRIAGFPVEVLNVLGAGDAFLAGFLSGRLSGESWERSAILGNACGALVVSRHGCAPAMPTRLELETFLSNAHKLVRPSEDPHLYHLHRVTTRARQWEELVILAFDHRTQLVDLARLVGAPLEKIQSAKNLILTAVLQAAEERALTGTAGVIIDDTYGQDALNKVTGCGLWVGRPIELAGSRPLRFEHGDLGGRLVSWPREHVVKCLVYYHPDDPIEMRLDQERSIVEAYTACCHSNHDFLLEVLPPPGAPRNSEIFARLIRRLYNLGVRPDWWKLPPLEAEGWRVIQQLIDERDPHCRGVLILGLDVPIERLREGFHQAADAKIVKGFAVGRTIFIEPVRQWMVGLLDDARLIVKIKENYLALVDLWHNRTALETKRVMHDG